MTMKNSISIKKNTLISFDMTMLNNVNVNQCKKCDFYLRKRNFIIFDDRPSKWHVANKKGQNKHPQLINMNF
jgi:hypothetical protein